MTAEDKASLGNAGAQQFTTTTTVRISGKVTADADADDGGAGEAEDALWRLQRQVEKAVICYPPIARVVQQLPFVRARVGIDSSSATHIGELRLEIGFECYQGPEAFYDDEPPDLTEVALTSPTLPGLGGVRNLNQEP